MLYRFTCNKCAKQWEEDTDNAPAVRCGACNRLGIANNPKRRKKRKDAKKAGRGFGVNDLAVNHRSVRTVKRKQMDEDFEDGADLDDPKDPDDEPEDLSDDESLPSEEFNISMRYSAGGGFDMTRVIAVATAKKFTPWTGITAAAGRSSTSAQFGGESADKHAARHLSGHKATKPMAGSRFEWCHLIADSLGGPTAQDNLFCGTYYANTAMLCIESLLRGKTHLEIQVEVDVRANTHAGEKITYRIRRKSTQGNTKRVKSTPFETVIDALATGCNNGAATALRKKVRTWLAQHQR